MYLPIIFGNFHFKPYILIGYLNVEVRVREAQVRCLTLTRMLFVFINISPAFRNISKNFINTVTVVVKILATARLTTVSCRARKCGASVLPGSWLCFYCYFCQKFNSDVHKHRLEGAIFMHVERTNQSEKLSNYKQFVSVFCSLPLDVQLLHCCCTVNVSWVSFEKVVPRVKCSTSRILNAPFGRVTQWCRTCSK